MRAQARIIVGAGICLAIFNTPVLAYVDSTSISTVAVGNSRDPIQLAQAVVVVSPESTPDDGTSHDNSKSNDSSSSPARGGNSSTSASGGESAENGSNHIDSSGGSDTIDFGGGGSNTLDPGAAGGTVSPGGKIDLGGGMQSSGGESIGIGDHMSGN